MSSLGRRLCYYKLKIKITVKVFTHSHYDIHLFVKFLLCALPLKNVFWNDGSQVRVRCTYCIFGILPRSETAYMCTDIQRRVVEDFFLNQLTMLVLAHFFFQKVKRSASFLNSDWLAHSFLLLEQRTQVFIFSIVLTALHFKVYCIYL